MQPTEDDDWYDKKCQHLRTVSKLAEDLTKQMLQLDRVVKAEKNGKFVTVCGTPVLQASSALYEAIHDPPVSMSGHTENIVQNIVRAVLKVKMNNQPNVQNECKTLTDAYGNNYLVHTMTRNGASLSEIIVALVNHISSQNKTISDFMAICPRRIKLDDGRVMVWHCPDDLVPIQESL